MTILEFLKINITSLASLLASAGIVIGSYISFSSSYVSAEEYQRDMTAQTKALKNFQMEYRVSNEQQKIQSIDDKIFFLEQANKPNDQDRALLNRLYRQRKDAEMILEKHLRQ